MLSFIYLRNREYICEIGNISSEKKIYHRKLLIYLRIYDLLIFPTKSIKKAIFLMKSNEIVKKISENTERDSKIMLKYLKKVFFLSNKE